MVEHYIGQEILANDYVEAFDGGKPGHGIMPLPCLMFIKLQFDITDKVLDDPSTIEDHFIRG